MHTQDHSHLFSGPAPLLTRRRRIIVGIWGELPKSEESVVSKRSMSLQRYPHDSLVEKSRITIF